MRAIAASPPSDFSHFITRPKMYTPNVFGVL